MTRDEIIQIVKDAATRFGIDQSIALAQIQQESGFNPRATSPQNARGLAQFIDSTWAMYGSGDPYDAAASMEAWGRLMSDLLIQFGGDYRKALIGYHSGAGAVEGVLRNPSGNPKSTAYYQNILGNSGNFCKLLLKTKQERKTGSPNKTIADS